MGFPWSRVKVWNDAETLYAKDLNAEFDSILQNNSPPNINDYSGTVGQMQTQTSPGGIGSESLATSLAGEIERLRYQLNQIIGDTYWYSNVPVNLSNLSSKVVVPPNRVVSGKTRGTLSGAIVSGFPAYLQANGASGVKVLGTSVPLVVAIKGTTYTLNSDLSSGALSAAPASNNTCTINETNLAGGDRGKVYGEDVGLSQGNLINVITSSKPSSDGMLAYAAMIVSSMGTNISNLTGLTAAFKATDSGNNDYFLAKVESSTQLGFCRRGYFFDNTLAPLPRVALSTSDTITLMKLTYVFLSFATPSAPSILVSYDAPIYAYTTPSSPNSGQFWYDQTNQIWKQYNGSIFVDQTCTFVGKCFQDSSGSTIGARPEDFYAAWDSANTVQLIVDGTGANLLTTSDQMACSVYGKSFTLTNQSIAYASDKDPANTTLLANQKVFFYVTDQGYLLYSNIPPHNRFSDLRGYYHPNNYWRCVGAGSLDGTPAAFAGVLNSLGSREYNQPLLIATSVSATNLSSTAVANISYCAFRGRSGVYRAYISDGYLRLAGSATGVRSYTIGLIPSTGIGSTTAQVGPMLFQYVAANTGDIYYAPSSTISVTQAPQQAGTGIVVYTIGQISSVSLNYSLSSSTTLDVVGMMILEYNGG